MLCITNEIRLMDGVDFRQLKSFLAVAEEGSITAAAKKLHLTQPAISRQIKALETELGVTLLERSAHSISITPSGEILARDGEKWVDMADRIIERVRAVAAGGVLRVAYAPSLAGSLLGLALERFSQRHPKMRVQLFDCTTAEMKQGLKDGRFDLIVTVPGDRDDGQIQWNQVLARPWKLAVRAGEATGDPRLIRELDGARLLIYQRDHYPDYWERVRAYFQHHGVTPVVVGEFDGWPSLKAAVEGGLGVALVADQEVSDGRFELRSLDPAPEPICVCVGWLGKEEAPVASQVLMEELRRAAEELSRTPGA